jgi:hypothetical protein
MRTEQPEVQVPEYDPHAEVPKGLVDRLDRPESGIAAYLPESTIDYESVDIEFEDLPEPDVEDEHEPPSPASDQGMPEQEMPEEQPASLGEGLTAASIGFTSGLATGLAIGGAIAVGLAALPATAATVVGYGLLLAGAALLGFALGSGGLERAQETARKIASGKATADEIRGAATVFGEFVGGIFAGVRRPSASAGGTGSTSTPSPALRGSPYSPEAVAGRVRPPYRANPAHDPRWSRFNPRKTPEPADAAQVYQSAVRADMGIWYGRGADGRIYRYFADNAGGVHFSGIVRPASVPAHVRKQLGE